MEMDRPVFDHKHKKIGAHLLIGDKTAGEAQADEIMQLHRIVDFMIGRQNAIDCVYFFDLLSDPPRYMGKMKRDEMGVWVMDAGANALAASEGPDGIVLDPDAWGFMEASSGIAESMRAFQILDRMPS